MQSDPASKPMAVTVYRLTTCPHCNAANGVTAIRCWSCDQPLSDKRWTGEVSEEELAPARDPALSDADFTFLDNDLLARRQQAAVEEAVATARTFESTRTLGHSAAPSLPHRPQVVERVDSDWATLPEANPPLRMQARPAPRLQPQTPAPLPPQTSLQRQSSERPPWQPPESMPYDQPLNYDAPLPFMDPPPALVAPSADGGAAGTDGGPSRFSVRGSAIGEAPGAAFRKRRPVEAIVLTLVLGGGIYAWFQPSPSPDDTSRAREAANRPPAIDAETQRLLDLSAPRTDMVDAPPPAPLVPPVVQTAPTPAPAPSPVASPSPVPAAATRPAPAPASVETPVSPASTVVAVPASPAAVPPAATDSRNASSTCAPNIAALGLCR